MKIKILKKGTFFAVSLSLSLLLGAWAGPRPAQAVQSVPLKLNFQGRLTNNAGSAMPDGLYNMTFRLYSTVSGGTASWTELREAGNRVQLTNGLFSVQLGEVTALPSTTFNAFPMYLEVELPTPATATCATAGCASWTEGAMTPRQALASSPYSFNANRLDGLDSSQLARLDAANTFTASQLFQNTTNSTSAFTVRNAAGSNLFTIDSLNSRLGLNLGGSNLPSVTFDMVGALRLAGSVSDTTSFVTPAAASTPTKINIPLYDPGYSGQVLALGLPSTTGVTSRAITLFDARTVAHQPTLGVFSVDEANLAGLSWEGASTTAYLKTTGGNLALRSGSSDLMTLLSGGNVGIGTVSPDSKLSVTGNGTGVARLGSNGCAANFAALSLGLQDSACNNYNLLSSPTDPTLYINRPSGYPITVREGNGADQLTIATGGNVGIGTTVPQAKLDIIAPSGAYNSEIGMLRLSYAPNPAKKLYMGWDDTVGAAYIQAVWSGNAFKPLLLNPNLGSVCIGTTSCNNKLGVNGSIGAAGPITASTTPDIAETIPAAPDVTAADVVMADPQNPERVVKSTTAYSPGVLGVISDGTGSFMINSRAGNSTQLTGAPLVLAGRVPVKITGEGGPVRPGDYLTSSSTPGYAMKANRAGPTIGKALGFFDGTSAVARGRVLVMVNLSYYDPAGGSSLQGTAAQFASLNVSGSVTLGQLTVSGDGNFLGNILVAGHIIGNPDTRGSLVIDAGKLFAEYKFKNNYAVTPTVVASPTSQAVLYRVVARPDGFGIYLNSSSQVPVTFNYMVQQ